MPRPELIIIDMQEDFFLRQPHLAEQRRPLVNAVNELSRGFRRAALPVIWVRQEFAPDLSDAPRDVRQDDYRVTIHGTSGCEILRELEREAGDFNIVKKRYSAFFGAGLDNLLAELKPSTLVLAGINTHACVRMTAIDAYQRDYRVVVATDCIASYDEEHHEITKRYLAGGKARLLSNGEILKLLTSDQPWV
jgi:nicotinamidase-related amidase